MSDMLTDSSLVIANRMYDLAHANKASLGLSSVWFGDQELIPDTPSLCVEPGTIRRDLQGLPDRTLNAIETYLLLYHSDVSGSQQKARRDCILVAENIQRYFHKNHLRLFDASGNLITIHGFCVEADPGFSFKVANRTLYNGVRMVWRWTTKTGLQVS